SSIDPDTNSIRVQSWNATIEQQVGSNWQGAPRYLGRYIDRIWGRGQISQGVYLGLDPCSLQGVFYPVCSTRASLQARRALTLVNPAQGRYYAAMYTFTDVGVQSYSGLKLSVQRRSANGV